MKRLFFVLSVLLFLSPAFSESTTYSDINFPQWSKDLRRTEIITFGSLPFVTIWATMGYTFYKYGEIRNPLNKSADGLTTADQKTIVEIAAVSCISLGLFDLTMNLIQREAKAHKARKERSADTITVTSEKQRLSEMEKQKNEETPPPPQDDRPRDYLSGEIFSVIF